MPEGAANVENPNAARRPSDGRPAPGTSYAGTSRIKFSGLEAISARNAHPGPSQYRRSGISCSTAHCATRDA
ncbi:MAG: hypothetical protein OJF60_003582 [Burkholderiaceae bacterium]|nr:MAG: hypothetical protein OJF60_003582 [Burkholderiaceae bacterium]